MKTNSLILGATGGIGYAVVNAHLDSGIPATLLVRNKKKAYTLFGHHPLLEVIEGDALDSALLNRLAADKTHIFHGLNASYQYWEEFMPLATKKVIEAASVANALIVFPGNIYNYGNISDPATEITPYNPNSSLGKVRVMIEKQLEDAANKGMIKSLVIRLPEIWGPEVTNKSFAPVFENAIQNKPIPWLYTIDVPQQLVWNMDAGRMIVNLMKQDFDQPFETVHYAGNTVLTMSDFFEIVKNEANADAGTKVVGRRMVQLSGVFNPVIRKVRELEYKYRNTILLDDKKCRQLVPAFRETPLPAAVKETIRWFKTCRITPEETKKRNKRKRFWIDFITDNTSIVLFPVIIALIGKFIPFIGNHAVLFGVVTGIYWAPGLRSLSRKITHKSSMAMAIVVMALLMLTSVSFGQDQQVQKVQPWEVTQVNVSFGLSLPVLHNGNELMRSKSLRNNSQSYYENDEGIHSSVGRYPPSLGWAMQMGFYKPVSFANRLMLGASVTASLTGSSPSTGGYEEGYFFNSILIGAAWKYYPHQTGKIAIKGDFGLASVFTKNRFLNSTGQQQYFHQFGIGGGGTAGLSWEFAQNWSIDITHSFMLARVEVNDIGNDQWTFGTTNAMIQYRF